MFVMVAFAVILSCWAGVANPMMCSDTCATFPTESSEKKSSWWYIRRWCWADWDH